MTDPPLLQHQEKGNSGKKIGCKSFFFFLMLSRFVSRRLDGWLRLFIVFIFVCLSVCQPHCGSVEQRTLTSNLLLLEQISVVVLRPRCFSVTSPLVLFFLFVFFRTLKPEFPRLLCVFSSSCSVALNLNCLRFIRHS